MVKYKRGSYIRTTEMRKKASERSNGRKHTSEEIEKMRIASTGRKHSKKTRKKMSSWQIGKKLSEETKRKISKSEKGKKVFFSKEHREKLSKALKGRKMSKEAKEKMSKAKKGKKLSITHIENNKLSRIGKKYPKSIKGLKSFRKKMSGSNNHNWQGGKSFEEYSQDWTDDLKDSIRKRDDYVCQECGIHQDELDYKLHCHHIDYNKKNCNPINLITLCRNCHLKTNYNRNYWQKYFKKYER